VVVAAVQQYFKAERHQFENLVAAVWSFTSQF